MREDRELGKGNIQKVTAEIFSPEFIENMKPQIQETMYTEQVKSKEHLTLQSQN